MPCIVCIAEVMTRRLHHGTAHRQIHWLRIAERDYSRHTAYNTLVRYDSDLSVAISVRPRAQSLDGVICSPMRIPVVHGAGAVDSRNSVPPYTIV